MLGPEVVLVTGASSGIGRELAYLFAADGSNLVLIARSEERLRTVASELEEAYGVGAQVLCYDLATPDAAQAVYDALAADVIEVDILVNNAGFGSRGLMAELPLETQVDMVQLNVTTVTALTRLLLPDMIRRGRGGILNLGSTASFEPGPGMAVYYATKAYVLSLTEALAVELDGTGVTATCLAPGPTRTRFAQEAGVEESPLFKIGQMDVGTVARVGYRGFRRGRVIVTPGLVNKFVTWSAQLSPRAVVRRVVGWLQMPD